MNNQTPITLNLELHEVNGIFAALSELPIKSNAMFLIQKIAGQVQPQMPEKEDVAA
jgi:hypothetical protein